MKANFSSSTVTSMMSGDDNLQKEKKRKKSKHTGLQSAKERLGALPYWHSRCTRVDPAL